MLEDAHRRRVEVWALDRLTREGMVATVGYLQRLAWRSQLQRARAMQRQRDGPRYRAGRYGEPSAGGARQNQRADQGGAPAREGQGDAAGAAGTRDALQQRIAAMVRDNPAATAYRVAKAVGCDPKSAKRYMATTAAT
jgi:hypothetical protein